MHPELSYIEKLLNGQVGVVLGLFIAMIIFAGFFKFVVAKLVATTAQQVIDKMEESISNNKEVIESTDRLTKVVGNLLLEIALTKLMQERGREAVNEINAAESKRAQK